MVSVSHRATGSSLAAAVLLAAVLGLASPSQAEEAHDSCACRFQPTDLADCRVYGQLGDGVLIAWHRASQKCLDVFKIKDEAIPPGTLGSIFPNGPDGDPRVSSMVSHLRFTDDAVTTGIKLSLTDFFVEDETGSGAVFKEEIVVDGQAVNCREDQGACWRAVTDYFNTDEGTVVLKNIGETLYNQQALSLEKEQSLVRIRLCSDGPDAECGALSDQVQTYVQDLGASKACSAYGLGPNTADLPFCTPDGGNNSGGIDSSARDTASAGVMSESNSTSDVESTPRYLTIAPSLVMIIATVGLARLL